MTTKHFELQAPEELNLPSFPGELQGFDPGEKPGYQVAWTLYWEVANGDALTKLVAPRQWRINGGGFDLRDIPDEYLMAALRDVALRRLGPFSERAGSIVQKPYSGWQDSARVLLEQVFGIERPRISRHNAPHRRAVMGGIPDELRDRIRD